MKITNTYKENCESFLKRHGITNKIVSVEVSMWFVIAMLYFATDGWLGLIFLALALISLCEYHFKKKHCINAYNNKENKDAEIKVEFDDNEFVIYENDIEKEKLRYDQCAYVHEHDDDFELCIYPEKYRDCEKKPKFLLIVSNYKEEYLVHLPKSGFAEGDIKRFRDFIKTKKTKDFKIEVKNEEKKK